MNKRTLLLIVLVVVAAGAFYAWREYDRGLESAGSIEAGEKVDAAMLLQAFTADEAKANARFNDKVVQVTGKVREVSAPEGGKVNVILDAGDFLSAVVCEFDSVGAPTWAPGTPVTIKGFCAGFNLDVLLQRCAAVE